MQDVPAKPLSGQTLPDLARSPLKPVNYEVALPTRDDASPCSIEQDLDVARPQNPLTAIRRKVARGEELTTEERSQLTAYYRRHIRRKQGVHLKGDREERWRTLAAQQGV